VDRQDRVKGWVYAAVVKGEAVDIVVKNGDWVWIGYMTKHLKRCHGWIPKTHLEDDGQYTCWEKTLTWINECFVKGKWPTTNDTVTVVNNQLTTVNIKNHQGQYVASLDSDQFGLGTQHQILNYMEINAKGTTTLYAQISEDVWIPMKKLVKSLYTIIYAFDVDKYPEFTLLNIVMPEMRGNLSMAKQFLDANAKCKDVQVHALPISTTQGAYDHHRPPTLQ
jgi:hypothetical protein